MSSYSNPGNINLLVDPTALGGNLYFIQLADNSTTLPSSQTISQVLINDYGGSENLQCLVPVLPNNQIEGQPNLQLILAQLENVEPSSACTKRSQTPEAQNVKDMIIKAHNTQVQNLKDMITKANDSGSNENQNEHRNTTIKNVVSEIKSENPKITSNILIKLPSSKCMKKNQTYKNPQHQNVKDNVLLQGPNISSDKKVTNQQHHTSISIPSAITNYVQIPDHSVPPRAVATLPPCLKMHHDRSAIYPQYQLTARVRFGPVRGINYSINHSECNQLVVAASAAHTPVFLMKRDSHSVIHLNVTDQDKSNWMSLLPLGSDSTANVWLYEEEGELYGITTKVILPRTPLALGYSKVYFEEHKLPSGSPVLDLLKDSTTSENPNSWRCMECNTELGSETLLQKHIYKHRMYTKSTKPKRAKCRCSHCKRIFSRKFSLRRHLKQGSCAMASRTNNESSPESKHNNTKCVTNVARNRTEQCPTPIEENRLSDESLQNYTSGLDISTNLFDPDRMPNLDTSGSDFNPFSLLPLGIKDENLASDAEYVKFSHDLMNKSNEKIFKDKPMTEEKVLCPYCKQSVLKSKNRQHFRTCEARKVKCECGQTFYKKESLSKHIQARHSDSVNFKTDVKKEKIKEDNENNPMEKPYKCEECLLVFKRRGMLVNHMWRTHDRATLVPVQHCVRLYPCTVCPKVYRTAAKRKQHTLTQHPGAGLEGARSIPMDRAACPAAVCPVCPREYATRAKLNQHQRAKHPLVAPPKIQRVAAKRKNTTPADQVQEQSDNQTSNINMDCGRT